MVEQPFHAPTSPADVIRYVARHTAAPIKSTPPKAHSTPVRWCIRHIALNYAHGLSLDGMAQGAGLSKFHLLRKFRNEVGIPPGLFLKHFRICKAMERLARSNRAIQTIAREVGYHDPAAFSRAFLKTAGTQPYLYRRTRQAAARLINVRGGDSGNWSQLNAGYDVEISQKPTAWPTTSPTVRPPIQSAPLPRCPSGSTGLRMASPIGGNAGSSFAPVAPSSLIR